MSCTKINKGINGRCAQSIGGIIEVYIANIDEWYYEVDSTDKDTLTVNFYNEEDDAKWYKYSFRRGTSSMNSTLNIDDANGVNYVSTELQMLFGRMDTKKRVAISALSTSDLLVIVKDANGKYWALGETEGVTASAGSGNTGQARSDANAYSITLIDNNATFPKEITKENFDAKVLPAIYEEKDDD